MIKDKSTNSVICKNQEEAIWYNQAEEAKAYIKQLKGSIKKAREEMKMTPRQIHAKFMKGAKENIKHKRLTLKVQTEFLKFCESKIEKQ